MILNPRSHPLDQVYSWIVVLSFGGLAGTFLATFVIELFERKWLVFTVAAVTGVGYLFLGFVDTVPVILGAGLTAVIASSILSTAVFTYTPEIFQTEVRGVDPRRDRRAVARRGVRRSMTSLRMRSP